LLNVHAAAQGYHTYGNVSISYDYTTKALKLKGEEHLVSPDKDTVLRTTEHVIPVEKTFIRWDGALVNEEISEGLFGFPTKNAQVFRHVEGRLQREVYKNYSFKGPFGEYWFSETSDVHVYDKKFN
jgi:hypothetical protein